MLLQEAVADLDLVGLGQVPEPRRSDHPPGGEQLDGAASETVLLMLRDVPLELRAGLLEIGTRLAEPELLGVAG
jgi:hypothetical protein